MVWQAHWGAQIALVGGDAGVDRRGDESARLRYDQRLRSWAAPGFVLLPFTLFKIEMAETGILKGK